MKKQLKKTTINDLKQFKKINLSSIYGGSIGKGNVAETSIGSINHSDV